MAARRWPVGRRGPGGIDRAREWRERVRKQRERLLDPVAGFVPGNRGLLARSRRRMRGAGFDDSAITIEAWHGALTVRGDVATREDAKRLEQTLSQVRGVEGVHNFVHVQSESSASD